jgi:hypothetical protein
MFARATQANHDDIDRGLAYDAERQLLSERIVLHARKLATQLGLVSRRMKTVSQLLRTPGAIPDWVAVPNS